MCRARIRFWAALRSVRALSYLGTFLVCPYRSGDNEIDSFGLFEIDYEITCTNAVLGCDHVCMRSELEAHLAKCPFRPATFTGREELERARNRILVVKAAEKERSRRMNLETRWMRQGSIRLGGAGSANRPHETRV